MHHAAFQPKPLVLAGSWWSGSESGDELGEAVRQGSPVNSECGCGARGAVGPTQITSRLVLCVRDRSRLQVSGLEALLQEKARGHSSGVFQRLVQESPKKCKGQQLEHKLAPLAFLFQTARCPIGSQTSLRLLSRPISRRRCIPLKKAGQHSSNVVGTWTTSACRGHRRSHHTVPCQHQCFG